MSFHCSMAEVLVTETRQLMGKSLYHFIHPEDLPIVATSVKTVFKKGYCHTPYYRLMSATGAATWVQTEATLVTQRAQQGKRNQVIVCLHQPLGSVSCKGIFMSPSTDCCSFRRHMNNYQSALSPAPAAMAADVKQADDQLLDNHNSLGQLASCNSQSFL